MAKISIGKGVLMGAMAAAGAVLSAASGFINLEKKEKDAPAEVLNPKEDTPAETTGTGDETEEEDVEA